MDMFSNGSCEAETEFGNYSLVHDSGHPCILMYEGLVYIMF
jgi:hypothetical protein